MRGVAPPKSPNFFSDLYKLPVDELKDRHLDVVVNRAISIWKDKFQESEISEKIDELQCFLERATSEQFIAVYRYYVQESRK